MNVRRGRIRRIGDWLFAPNEMLAQALRKSEALPLLFRYGPHHRLLSEMREGVFIAWPVHPGPREVFLHYAPPQPGILIRLGQENSARADSLPTAPYVRFVGIDDEALCSALSRCGLSDACVFRLPSDGAFVLDAFFGTYAVLSIWSADLRVLGGAAYPIMPTADPPTPDRHYRQKPNVSATQRLHVFEYDTAAGSSTMAEDLERVLSGLG